MPDDNGCSGHPLEADTRPGEYQRQAVASLLVPGLTLLYHPDLERLGERALLPGLPSGYGELLSRRQPDSVPPDRPLRRPLEDGYLSRQPARLPPGRHPRCRSPYLAVNMGAIPASLAAAELFGAARGAFTGADRPREGYFVRAHGGTLFLDEIGETPPEIQVLLLRTLETGEIQPVGGTPRQVDVRWLAATDARLEDDVAAGRFRAPLLHRLGGYQIQVAPLRRRRADP